MAQQDASDVVADSLQGQRLVYSNDGGASFAYRPAQLTISVDSPVVRQRYPDAERLRLSAPAGWTIAPAAEIQLSEQASCWTVVPQGEPQSCAQAVVISVLAGDRVVGTVECRINVEIRGRSQFDPQRHIPPFRNAAADIGEVEPRRTIFAHTFRPGGVILPDAFFHGLYRDIVFLTPEVDVRGSGGLCTGMARYALQCSLQGETANLIDRRTVALNAVERWHGRQLTDQALLAAAQQFFHARPAVAFAEFRRQVFARSMATMAFDVGIARWNPSPTSWPAMVHRLVTQGHTIVPYAFVQTDDDHATVSVYDPSHPTPDELANDVMHFDLANDRYAYRSFGALDHDDPTTVLAVPQAAYEGSGTAYLASLANLFIHPETVRPALRGSGALVRLALVATACVLVGLGLIWRRRQRA